MSDKLQHPPQGEIIPLSVPEIRGNEWTYVKDCLDTKWVSYVGPYVDRFERALADATAAPFAVATASGTAAIHIALLLAGVGVDDEVVMPGLTFVAPANAVRYCGAWPVLVDVSPRDWQWDADTVAEFFAKTFERRAGRWVNRRTGRRVAAVLAVHLLGGMADVDALASMASRFELPLIEDAAECVGATFRHRAVGAPCEAYRGPLRLVATSFNGNKIVTTGGGGAILCASEKVARRARHLTTTAKADPVEFYHDEVGYNYRLTNIAAAMGVAQLEKLAEYVDIKRGIAERYAAALAGHPRLRTHPEPANCRGTFWMYTVLLDRPSRPVIDRLNGRGIMSRPLWQPLDRLPAFQGCAGPDGLPSADALYRHALSLPCSVGLSREQQVRVVDELTSALQG